MDLDWDGEGPDHGIEMFVWGITQEQFLELFDYLAPLAIDFGKEHGYDVHVGGRSKVAD